MLNHDANNDAVTPMLPRLIGLAGFKRSGKDTFAQAIRRLTGHTVIGFSDAIRQEVAEIYQVEDRAEDAKDHPVSEADKSTYRDLLIKHGMERRQLLPTYWIDRAADQIRQLYLEGEAVIITGVRMAEEAAWLHRNGGIVIWIDREGCESDGQPTENDLREHANYIVSNNVELDAIDGLAESTLDFILSSDTPTVGPALHWAVTGRIPDDKEDITLLIRAVDAKQAIEMFENSLWEDREDAEEARERTFNAHGTDAFVNSLVCSQTPLAFAPW